MASPTLSDTFSLDHDRINQKIIYASPGVYVLDATTSGGFTVSYTGRSDTDVNKRLHDWVGKYKYFKFAYSSSPKDAFEGECNLYHDYRPADNAVHPARPNGSGWKCPRCGIFLTNCC